MTHQRVAGISSLVTVCQCVLAIIVFDLWLFLSSQFISPQHIDVIAHQVYALTIAAGLVLAFLFRFQPLISIPDRQPTLYSELPKALRETATSIGFLLFVLFLGKDFDISRFFLLTFVPIYYVTLVVSGRFLPGVLERQLSHGKRRERVVLIGGQKRVVHLKGWLESKQTRGVETVGLVSNADPSLSTWPMILGPPENLEEILIKHKITEAILLELPVASWGFEYILHTLNQCGVRLSILNNLEEELHHAIVPYDDCGLKFFSLRHEPLENPFNRVVKRTIDLCVSIPSALIILPIAAVIVKIIQLIESPGPLFYVQRRGGMHNKEFKMFKFRTMHLNDSQGQQAYEGDPRIFPAGRWLRRFSLDELPQILNVVAGKMSIVGPRPHLAEHNLKFAEPDAEYHIRAFVKPGITGLAQVRGLRGRTVLETEIAARLESDLLYLETWSVKLDLLIIFKTVGQVVFPPKKAL